MRLIGARQEHMAFLYVSSVTRLPSISPSSLLSAGVARRACCSLSRTHKETLVPPTNIAAIIERTALRFASSLPLFIPRLQLCQSLPRSPPQQKATGAPLVRAKHRTAHAVEVSSLSRRIHISATCAAASPRLRSAMATPSSSSHSVGKLRYIDADTAKKIDEALMGPDCAFSIDQLMELAGLACAQTVFACYPPDAFPTILVAAGPGNQGGDGLVAARHLSHFGYQVLVWYPKEGKTELFQVRRHKKKGGICCKGQGIALTLFPPRPSPHPPPL